MVKKKTIIGTIVGMGVLAVILSYIFGTPRRSTRLEFNPFSIRRYTSSLVHPNEQTLIDTNKPYGTLIITPRTIEEKVMGRHPRVIHQSKGILGGAVIINENGTDMVYYINKDGQIMKIPYQNEPESVSKHPSERKYAFLDASPNGHLITRTWDGEWSLDNFSLENLIATDIGVFPYRSLEDELTVYSLKKGNIYVSNGHKENDKIKLSEPQQITFKGDYYEFELIPSKDGKLKAIVALRGNNKGRDIYVLLPDENNMERITYDLLNPLALYSKIKFGLEVSENGVHVYVSQSTWLQALEVVRYDISYITHPLLRG